MKTGFFLIWESESDRLKEEEALELGLEGFGKK